MTRTLGSHDTSTESLGFFPGGGLPGGGLDFSPGNFSFGESQFEIQQGGAFDFGDSFSFGQDILGQLPTELSDDQLPSFSQNDYPGQGEDLEWTGLVKQLLKLGPAYIEAFRRGNVEAPESAPSQAKSSDSQDREAALRRAISRIQQERSQSDSGGTLAGIDTTTAILGAGVAASLVLAIRS